MRPGFFILEGPEAAGKTTQLRLIVDALNAIGHDVLASREPGGTAIGERIRAVLLDPGNEGIIQPLTSMLLFNASRRQWMHEVVEPALAAGKTVIGDRSFLSTMVYQAYVEGLDPAFTREVCMKAMGGRMPDRIFLLDIPPEEIRRRLTKDAMDKTSRYDVMGDAFHAKVREGYLAQRDLFPGLIEPIDGEALPEEIARIIVGRMTDIMK